jgi:hypothetical protein
MVLAATEQQFQLEWGTRPWCLVEVIAGVRDPDLSVGEYKAKVKRSQLGPSNYAKQFRDRADVCCLFRVADIYPNPN